MAHELHHGVEILAARQELGREGVPKGVPAGRLEAGADVELVEIAVCAHRAKRFAVAVEDEAGRSANLLERLDDVGRDLDLAVMVILWRAKVSSDERTADKEERRRTLVDHVLPPESDELAVSESRLDGGEHHRAPEAGVGRRDESFPLGGREGVQVGVVDPEELDRWRGLKVLPADRAHQALVQDGDVVIDGLRVQAGRSLHGLVSVDRVRRDRGEALLAERGQQMRVQDGALRLALRWLVLGVDVLAQPDRGERCEGGFRGDG